MTRASKHMTKVENPRQALARGPSNPTTDLTREAYGHRQASHKTRQAGPQRWRDCATQQGRHFRPGNRLTATRLRPPRVVKLSAEMRSPTLLSMNKYSSTCA